MKMCFLESLPLCYFLRISANVVHINEMSDHFTLSLSKLIFRSREFFSERSTFSKFQLLNVINFDNIL